MKNSVKQKSRPESEKQIKKNLNKFISVVYGLLIIFSVVSFNGCYSVFDGGTGGVVVDAESTSNPKAGIANVNVYAYLKEKERNADFDNWISGTQSQPFLPSVKYYGHTTTNADGSWNIGKLVWKSYAPDFGKDADYEKIYLIFYHEEYGCVKGQTIIMSDSSSDYTYSELTSVVKKSILNLNILDVSDLKQAGKQLYVEVKVPQATDKNPSASDNVYKTYITGNGSLLIRYPRYVTESGVATYSKTAEENCPEIKINYYQPCEESEVNWKACKYDTENSDFSFYAGEVGRDCDGLTKKVLNSTFTVNLYGKANKLSVPNFSGTYGDTSSASSDKQHIFLKGKNSSGAYTVDLGDVYTSPSYHGADADATHGSFSGLGGDKYFWTDESYTARYSEYSVQFQKEDGSVIKTISVRSDNSSYNITL